MAAAKENGSQLPRRGCPSGFAHRFGKRYIQSMTNNLQLLIARIRERLSAGSYSNEAAVSHGIVIPILNSLGWDSADPDSVVPEYTSGRGRVDFALLGRARKPSIFVEVKGVGRSLDGDRQLFEYAFHEGVPLCILTDGREWSFYLPSGQGSYDDRRLYRLQIDDRSPEECERVLARYVRRERVLSGEAFEDAQRDHRQDVGRREAVQALPLAWSALLSDADEMLLDVVAERAEALCGFRPTVDDTRYFLAALSGDATRPVGPLAPSIRTLGRGEPQHEQTSSTDVAKQALGPAYLGRAISYRVFGEQRAAANANAAFIDILKSLAARDASRIPAWAEAVRARSRNHIARTPAEIYPSRPDLARAAEFATGWLVGLNISNRDKMRIIRSGCDAFGIEMGQQIQIQMPNAD